MISLHQLHTFEVDQLSWQEAAAAWTEGRTNPRLFTAMVGQRGLQQRMGVLKKVGYLKAGQDRNMQLYMGSGGTGKWGGELAYPEGIQRCQLGR